jgi:hypothetical protein
VNGHQRSHSMIDLRTGETITVTSTHHQQMIAASTGCTVIGVSNESTFKMHENAKEIAQRSLSIRDGKDAEILWYGATRSLCIQGHPEYVPNSRFAKYTLELINEMWASIQQRKTA